MNQDRPSRPPKDDCPAVSTYGEGPYPRHTVYYRRLQQSGGSLMVSLPAAVKQRWGAIRSTYVRVILWDDGDITIQPVQEGEEDEAISPDSPPDQDPGASGPA